MLDRVYLDSSESLNLSCPFTKSITMSWSAMFDALLSRPGFALE